jgi:hypothetical protein
LSIGYVPLRATETYADTQTSPNAVASADSGSLTESERACREIKREKSCHDTLPWLISFSLGRHFSHGVNSSKAIRHP